jgi:hypothetical protein
LIFLLVVLVLVLVLECGHEKDNRDEHIDPGRGRSEELFRW